MDHIINKDIDWWVVANQFVDKISIKEIEKQFSEHCKSFGYNYHESQYFRQLVSKAFELKLTVAFLNYQIK